MDGASLVSSSAEVLLPSRVFLWGEDPPRTLLVLSGRPAIVVVSGKGHYMTLKADVVLCSFA